MSKKASVAKASPKKKVGLAIGSWVEVIKANCPDGGHKKGTQGVLVSKSGSELYVATVDDKGEGETFYHREDELKGIEAPKFVVAWSNTYTDPFTYATSLVAAKRLAARRRVGGYRVVEARIFKAV